MTLRILLNTLFLSIISSIFLFLPQHSYAQDSQDQEVADGADLDVEVKNRLYITEKTIEFSLLYGQILNHSYIRINFLTGSLVYYFNSKFGLGISFSYAINDLVKNVPFLKTQLKKDKTSRSCLESFYYTANHKIDINPSCIFNSLNSKEKHSTTVEAYQNHAQEDLAPYQNLDPAPRIGPAYPSVREIDMVILARASIIPSYGKLLLFMRKVVHFNNFINIDAGVTIADYFPNKTHTDSNHPYRGPAPIKGSGMPVPGVTPDQINDYGINGRPKPNREITPTASLAVGQKFHLTQNLSLHIEARNYTLINLKAKRGIELYFSVSGGLGIRF